jgi:hypothetical protein
LRIIVDLQRRSTDYKEHVGVHRKHINISEKLNDVVTQKHKKEVTGQFGVM